MFVLAKGDSATNSAENVLHRSVALTPTTSRQKYIDLLGFKNLRNVPKLCNRFMEKSSLRNMEERTFFLRINYDLKVLCYLRTEERKITAQKNFF